MADPAPYINPKRNRGFDRLSGGRPPLDHFLNIWTRITPSHSHCPGKPGNDTAKGWKRVNQIKNGLNHRFNQMRATVGAGVPELPVEFFLIGGAACGNAHAVGQLHPVQFRVGQIQQI